MRAPQYCGHKGGPKINGILERAFHDGLKRLNGRLAINRLAPMGLLVACLVLCFAAVTPASEPLSIVLKETADVAGAVVQLGDISILEGADAAKKTKLAGLRIDSAPAPGKSVLIQTERVVSRLAQFGLAPADYHLTAGSAVKVISRSVEVPAETVRQAVKSYISSQSPWTAGQIKIRKIRMNHPVHLPPGEMHIQVQAPKHTDWLGAIPFSVKFLVKGQVVSKLTVPATIEVWSDVLLAAKPLGRGQPVTPDSIKMVRMNLSRAPANAILSKEQALGRRVNRSIAANSILRDDQIEMPPVVKRGDLVQVVAQSQAMMISIKGVAKQDGARGDRIRVENMRSKRIIYAQVLDNQTVQVDF